MIRSELTEDFDAVFDLHAACFPTPAEANLVKALRRSASPIVSLVAEVQYTVVGHIMFSPVTLANYSGLLMGLAPVAVAAKHQQQGIGSALIKAGLLQCQRLNAAYVVVLGDAGYYSRFGFTTAAPMGLDTEYDVPVENFMAIRLATTEQPPAKGIIRYHQAFANV